jgi:hypothetical protein
LAPAVLEHPDARPTKGVTLIDANNDSARVKLSREEIIAEARDLTDRDGLTFAEALAILLLEGYADETTDTTYRISAWTVRVV